MWFVFVHICGALKCIQLSRMMKTNRLDENNTEATEPVLESRLMSFKVAIVVQGFRSRIFLADTHSIDIQQ